VNDLGLVEAGLCENLLELLRVTIDRPDLAFQGRPTRLSGGFWAELVAFRLQGAPAGWDGELVLRLMPDPVTAARESAVQTEVAAQGFPTPWVRLSGGVEAGLGRAFMVMDRAPGGPLLAGLDGFAAITALPRLARRLPDVLAETMAHLHHLDTEPLRARLAGGDGVPGLLAELATTAESCGRRDLAAAAGRLLDHPPAPAPAPVVICHGDLHPFNVLAAPEDTVTVLDWSTAMLAPAAFDLAYTNLLLAEPPILLPSALRGPVRVAGRLLARRFRATYTRLAAPVEPDMLRWHTGVVCLRALVQLAQWTAEGRAADYHHHPWSISAPAYMATLTRTTTAS
jgi:aminoglycoside phosphotransferase (APT) family kinase protein